MGAVSSLRRETSFILQNKSAVFAGNLVLERAALGQEVIWAEEGENHGKLDLFLEANNVLLTVSSVGVP